MRRFALLSVALLFAMGLALQGGEPTGTMEAAASSAAAGPVKLPVITLESVEVAHYWPYYFDAKEKTGSPLDLAFVFRINNPNDFKIMLDEFRFAAAFEDFIIIEPWVYEDQWIPPMTTNQLRVHAVFDASRVKKPADQVKKWWDAIPDFSFPVQAKNGVANFVGPDGKTSIAYFEGVFPPPK